MILDLHPDELNDVASLVMEIMQEELPKTWKWINVPMTVEPELTEINESWYNKKEIHPEKCNVCFSEWMWEKKLENRIKTFECPMCGDIK